MPAALFNNASPPAMLMDKSREMDVATAERKRLALCPTDDDSIAPKSKKPHKQSFDYIWRSAVAGGLAGSAVCATQNTRNVILTVGRNRQKPSLPLLTVSRSSSKSQNTQAHGLVL
jgi:hypothetical protein